MLGITQMMGFFEKHYAKKYAPNSRETVRRQTVHQFLQAALIVENPDKPDRPTNSGKTVYQISEHAARLLRSYNSPEWQERLAEYMDKNPSLRRLYEKRRRMRMIPLKLPSDQEIRLSPGGQNALVRMICEEFAPRFAPAGMPLYVGDTAKKFAHFDKGELEGLGIHFEPHGKIPDVIIYDTRRNWIFLVEAVTSHGPVDEKRRRELERIFSRSKAGPVYVTAFADRKTMKKYITEISWETEVWVADSPDHMIHFDGERFLGPYGKHES